MTQPYTSKSGYPRHLYRARCWSKPNYRTVILTNVRYALDDTIAYRRITINSGQWSRNLAVGARFTFTASPQSSGALTWIRAVPHSRMPHGWSLAKAKRRERQALLREYQSGQTLAELAETHAIRRQTVSARLKEAHVEIGLPPPRNFNRANGIKASQVACLYRQPDVSKRDISRRLHIGCGTVDAILRQAGIGSPCRHCKQRELPAQHRPCQQCARERDERYAQAHPKRPVDKPYSRRYAIIKPMGICGGCRQPKPAGYQKAECPVCMEKTQEVRARKRLEQHRHADHLLH